MKYTREQIEDCAHDLKEESANAENALFGSNDKAALMLRQLLAENEALRDALESIALAGMSGCGQESEEGLRDCHARRAWEFIGTAARALETARKEYP